MGGKIVDVECSRVRGDGAHRRGVNTVARVVPSDGDWVYSEDLEKR